jgi:hypothetical protein
MTTDEIPAHIADVKKWCDKARTLRSEYESILTGLRVIVTKGNRMLAAYRAAAFHGADMANETLDMEIFLAQPEQDLETVTTTLNSLNETITRFESHIATMEARCTAA